MSVRYPEVKDNHLYRLIPNQRRHLSLRLLADNGAMSHNALYVKTVPSSINKGRTKSIGTWNDIVLNALMDAGLIENKVTRKQIHAFRPRYHSSFTITNYGREALTVLDQGFWIYYNKNGSIESVAEWIQIPEQMQMEI